MEKGVKTLRSKNAICQLSQENTNLKMTKILVSIMRLLFYINLSLNQVAN